MFLIRPVYNRLGEWLHVHITDFVLKNPLSLPFPIPFSSNSPITVFVTVDIIHLNARYDL